MTHIRRNGKSPQSRGTAPPIATDLDLDDEMPKPFRHWADRELLLEIKMAEKTIDRQKTFEGAPDEVGCTFTVADSGVKVNCPVWQLFAAEIPDLNDDGTPRKKAEIQADFDKSKESAVAFVAEIQAKSRGGIYAIVHGTNAAVGDTGNTTDDVDPAKVMRERWKAICAGQATMRSGGGDPATEMFRSIVAMDARTSLGLGKTKAADAVRDQLAKTETAIAKKRGVAVDVYREQVQKRVAVALGLDA